MESTSIERIIAFFFNILQHAISGALLHVLPCAGFSFLYYKKILHNASIILVIIKSGQKDYLYQRVSNNYELFVCHGNRGPSVKFAIYN